MDVLLHVCRALGLFALARWATRRRLRILCYHGIWMGPAPHFGDRLFMDPERFARRVASLQAAGYVALSLGEAWERCRQGRLRGREIVITIDDGWTGTARHMRPVLRQLGWPSTLYLATHDFLIGAPVPPVMATWLLARARKPLDPVALLNRTSAPADWALALEEHVRSLPDRAAQEAQWCRWGDALGVDVRAVLATRSLHLMSADELRQCAAEGMDVQLHTHHHDLGDLSAAVVTQEVARNRAELSRLLGRDPDTFTHFCYPSGVHDERAFAPLRAAGVHTATTTDFGLAGARHEPMALPRILDGQTMSDIALEARLSGFWYWVDRVRGRVSA
jgi:peptidoglycan/xylan/chitin deacetylase (PgdA/CDA1 family)